MYVLNEGEFQFLNILDTHSIYEFLAPFQTFLLCIFTINNNNISLLRRKNKRQILLCNIINIFSFVVETK